MMLVKDLINQLQRLDEELEVKLLIETVSPLDGDNMSISAHIQSIEFNNELAILKGDENLSE